MRMDKLEQAKKLLFQSMSFLIGIDKLEVEGSKELEQRIHLFLTTGTYAEPSWIDDEDESTPSLEQAVQAHTKLYERDEIQSILTGMETQLVGNVTASMIVHGDPKAYRLKLTSNKTPVLQGAHINLSTGAVVWVDIKTVIEDE